MGTRLSTAALLRAVINGKNEKLCIKIKQLSNEVSEYHTRYFPSLPQLESFCLKCKQFQMAKFPSVFSHLTWAAVLAQGSGKGYYLGSQTDLMSLFLPWMFFFYLDLKIFANEWEAGLHCHISATQLSTDKPSSSQWLHAIIPSSQQKRQQLTSLFPGGYWFDADPQRHVFLGVDLFIYPVLFLFLGTTNKIIALVGNGGWTLR